MRSPSPRLSIAARDLCGRASCGACCLLAGSVTHGRTQEQVCRRARSGPCQYCLASDSLAPGTKASLRWDFYSTHFQEARVICQIAVECQNRDFLNTEVFHSENNGSSPSRKLWRVHADSRSVTHSKCDAWFHRLVLSLLIPFSISRYRIRDTTVTNDIFNL